MKRKPRRPPVTPRQHQAGFPDVLKPLARLVEHKRYDDVERLAGELRRVLPSHPFVLKALSFSLIGQGRHDEALPVLEQAIALDGLDAELHNNLGIVWASLMRSERAVDAFRRSLELEPGDAEIWNNLGAAYCYTNRWAEAIPCLLKAIELHPGDYDDAIHMLAGALLSSNRNEEALSCFTVLAEAEPDNAECLGALIHLALRMVRWGVLAESLARLKRVACAIGNPEVRPFHALSMPGISGGELRKFAESHVAAETGAAAPKGGPLFAHYRTTDSPGDRRIRIGYMSYDFRDHPVGHVLPRIIELHDRSRFEVLGYSLAPDDGSVIRQRLVRAFDRFTDITGLGIKSGAEKIAGDQIDILVDLQGLTTGNRIAMLATRPAPIQVNWLGYAGTMGDPRLADYVFGDPVVTPLEHQAFFSEKIIQLPQCYLPMDDSMAVPPPPSRSDAGLPEDAFVFCSMNNCYKFNPQVFDVWCSILDATPGSVLWLSQPAGVAAANLRVEASARGVAPDRIIYAGRVATRSDHLARLQLADLALDPWPYNSHSSGIDVLWAGVPMVSMLGDSFAGRVGASLLHAAGLRECIAGSPAEYLALCIDLYRQPERLRQIKQQLVANRTGAPLFDMKRFVGALEDIYRSLSSKI
ncbi:MAG: tetratricopeptide repeat protein [Sulfuritalea sp.]|nr:tetratricopeptide repeat protein [Sulfuritalea sp.]MDP1984339.1 tetratricopeptide repeat protein [Sulfuritalea sp.]